MGQVVYLLMCHVHTVTRRVLQATHTTVRTSTSTGKRKAGASKSTNVWAKTFSNAYKNNKLMVVCEKGMTRKRVQGDKAVVRITCLVYWKNVCYNLFLDPV